jgi:hypothetical protein
MRAQGGARIGAKPAPLSLTDINLASWSDVATNVRKHIAQSRKKCNYYQWEFKSELQCFQSNALYYNINLCL